jgi:hypothetical protein
MGSRLEANGCDSLAVAGRGSSLGGRGAGSSSSGGGGLGSSIARALAWQERRFGQRRRRADGGDARREVGAVRVRVSRWRDECAAELWLGFGLVDGKKALVRVRPRVRVGVRVRFRAFTPACRVGVRVRAFTPACRVRVRVRVRAFTPACRVRVRVRVRGFTLHAALGYGLGLGLG